MTSPSRYTMDDLLSIVAALRDPKTGCPWDIRQTHESLLHYLIDEAYEYIEAVAGSSDDDMKDELGDILFQVIFHANITQDNGKFDFGDIVNHLCRKMISRHPHVFANPQGKRYTEQEVNTAWQRKKREERGEDKDTRTEVAKVKFGRPALFYARSLGAAAAKHAFDWPDTASVIEKIREECDEILEPDADLTEEIGDLMFATVQLCRKANLDPEATLRKAAQKFARRFEKMANETPLPDTLAAWEERWKQVKE